ncbi:hypothetical protein MRX96_051456 [Rhipicephalus microplus]
MVLSRAGGCTEEAAPAGERIVGLTARCGCAGERVAEEPPTAEPDCSVEVLSSDLSWDLRRESVRGSFPWTTAGGSAFSEGGRRHGL